MQWVWKFYAHSSLKTEANKNSSSIWLYSQYTYNNLQRTSEMQVTTIMGHEWCAV